MNFDNRLEQKRKLWYIHKTIPNQFIFLGTLEFSLLYQFIDKLKEELLVQYIYNEAKFERIKKYFLFGFTGWRWNKHSRN